MTTPMTNDLPNEEPASDERQDRVPPSLLLDLVTPASMLRTLLTVLSLMHAVSAYHMPTLVPRMAVRAHGAQRTASISMVKWDAVPADTLWTKDAWEAMHLTGEGLHGCILIPDKFVPDTGLLRLSSVSNTRGHPMLTPACYALSENADLFFVLACRQWYFCTYNGAVKAGANCIELPTYSEEVSLYLCSMGHGALPSYAE